MERRIEAKQELFQGNFEFLLDKIYRNKGIDFGLYRHGTLKRRVSSRLTATKCADYETYIYYLNRNPVEYDHLINVLTINLTEFFRDTETFKALEKKIIPEIIRNKESKKQKIIRVWSAGASNGEEAYSLAMLFLEAFRNNKNNFTLHVYGTDIDVECLAKAKAGTYDSSRIKKIPANLVQKYFEFNNGLFQVRPELRQITRFKQHNLVSDAPLPHMDLILCRNVLIYFSRTLQETVCMNLTHVLNPGGFLVLGKVESLWGVVAKKYEVVDAVERIYRKTNFSDAISKGGNENGTEYE